MIAPTRSRRIIRRHLLELGTDVVDAHVPAALASPHGWAGRTALRADASDRRDGRHVAGRLAHGPVLRKYSMPRPSRQS
jgi:hypothetical protein